jgi:hypothetical protein
MTARSAIIVVAAVLGASPLAAQNFSKLGFMAGCWQGTTGKEQTVEENWTTPSDHLMLGVARYFTKKQAVSYEFTVIERTDTASYVISMPKDQPPDTFRLKMLVDEAASWERTGSTFPGRIMYRRASDGSLIVRLEAPPGSAEPSVEVRMLRGKCPSG